MSDVWQVIVVGGGPGGAVAAMRCAAAGLKTLLLEKKRMPRDKCCSGMVMGPWAQNLLRMEFGDYPEHVLAHTTDLKGYAVHVQGVPTRTLDVHTPATWRRVLDTWMCYRARQAGARLRDAAEVLSVSPAGERWRVRVRSDVGASDLTTDFLIGADGARSAVRKGLFPDYRPTYRQCYREYYDLRLDLPERRFHIFALGGADPFFFVHEKEDHTLVEGVAVQGQLQQTLARARRVLIDHHGFDPNAKPLWRDGCLEPVMYRELATCSFRPARGSALLVGDAAGLSIPVTGEGLGTSLKTGLDAAHAVLQAAERGESVEPIYMSRVDELLKRYETLYPSARRIGKIQPQEDPLGYADALSEAWELALKVLEPV